MIGESLGTSGWRGRPYRVVGVNRSEISDLAHTRHPIASPLSNETVDRLLALAVTGQRSVLDLGCGDGTWLLRALRREPTLTAVGVDVSGAGFDRVLEQANREGLGERLQLVHADVREWRTTEKFDVVLSIGAAYAFGGLLPTLAAADEHLHPDGQLLLGDCIWEQAPSEQTLALLGAATDDYCDLSTTVQAVDSAGWVPVEGHVSTLQEWDSYEWSWTGSLARWALDHPDHPDSQQVMTASVEHRRAWLGGYRGTLGFLTMLLRRSTLNAAPLR
ncbi:methyltransferase family protein [Citricoccus muralis]|uniref:Methyltransferase family protein n=1 Tax=Citricoccus muralis TaxID=169134 RepID=A0A3D9L7G2_9MICC|nr:methyltransferase family protein [Citricoccus muralis]